MENFKEVRTPVADAAKVRRPYVAPTLRYYGAVAQMTQGSGGMSADGGSMTMMD